jgi:hypothetical protein
MDYSCVKPSNHLAQSQSHQASTLFMRLLLVGVVLVTTTKFQVAVVGLIGAGLLHNQLALSVQVA